MGGGTGAGGADEDAKPEGGLDSSYLVSAHEFVQYLPQYLPLVAHLMLLLYFQHLPQWFMAELRQSWELETIAPLTQEVSELATVVAEGSRAIAAVPLQLVDGAIEVPVFCIKRELAQFYCF